MQPPSAHSNVKTAPLHMQPPPVHPNVESALPACPNLESMRMRAHSSHSILQPALSHPQSIPNLPHTKPPPVCSNVKSAPTHMQPPPTHPNVKSAQPGRQFISALEHLDKFLAAN